MTDTEMVKVMEVCKDKEMPCDDCPLVEYGDCEEISRRYFYDRFKELEAENAELRERLDKAVELPCKAGDKVYIPWAWDNQSGIVEAPVVTIRLYPYTRKYEIRLETNSLTFAQKYQYGNFNDKDFGTLIFTTREAAEARLRELQGEKQ